MFRVIMRRNVTKCMAIRGGHGWDRPDVPLTIPYTHKRRMDVFDTNLWFYCGVMPEYFINQNEAYLVSMQQAAKQFVIDARFIFAAFVACYFMDKVLFEPRFWNIQPDHLKNPTFNFPRKVIKERSTMVKHFLDLSITGDMGKLRITPGEKGYLSNITEVYEEQNTHIQQINAEGKGFIERVEQEAKRAVAQKHGEQTTHH